MGNTLRKEVIMGSLKDKLSWLIDRKKQLVDWVNSKTQYGNTTGASKPFSGKYSSINWDDIYKQMYGFFPSGFAELIVCGHYENGSANSSYYVGHYVRPGVSISVSRFDTGKYSVSVSHPSDLNGMEYHAFAFGGHQGSNFNNNAYATIMPMNYVTSSGTTHNYEVYVSDDVSRNDGSFTIFIFASRNAIAFT